MMLIWMAASLWVKEVHHNCGGWKIKSQPQVTGPQLQLPSGKGETYWKDTGDSGCRNQSRSKTSVTIVVVHSWSHVPLFVILWAAACQAPPSFTISWSLLKLMFIESMMPSNHLILCHPLLLLPSIFPSIRIFFYKIYKISQFFPSGGQSIGASTSASVLSMNIQGWFPLGFFGLIALLSKGLSRVFSSTTVWKHQFFSTQPSYGPTLTSLHDYWKNNSDYMDLCQ